MKKVYNTLWLLLLLSFALPQQAEAQRYRRRHQQRFKAGLLLGAGLSQIDGDHYSGFDKGNLQFGASGSAILSEHSEVGVEFLYAGRGSRVASDKSSVLEIKNRRIELRYMEVPILFRYRSKVKAPTSFFEAGFSYGRIIRSVVTEPSFPSDGFVFQELEPDFNRNEVTLLGSYGIQVSRHLHFKFRFGFALTQLYDNPAEKLPRPSSSFYLGVPDGRIEFLRNYYIALMGHYQF